MKPSESPILIVDEVSGELGELASLCHVLSLNHDPNECPTCEQVSDSFRIVRNLLEKQTEKLDGIDWEALRP